MNEQVITHCRRCGSAFERPFKLPRWPAFHKLGLCDGCMRKEMRMSALSNYFSTTDKVARWKAETENAHARLELAQIEDRFAELLSQHEPVATIGLDRVRLSLLFTYIRYGDKRRLMDDYAKLATSA